MMGRRATLILLCFVAAICSGAQPGPNPPQPVDLTGAWSWGGKACIDVVQKGTSVTFNFSSGLKFTGTFVDGTLDLSGPLTMKTVNPKYPPQIQSLLVNGFKLPNSSQSQRGVDVIHGTLNDNGDGISGYLEDDDISFEVTSKAATITADRRAQHTIHMGRLSVSARWAQPDDTPAGTRYTFGQTYVVPVKYKESRPVKLTLTALTNYSDPATGEPVDMSQAITQIVIKQSFGDSGKTSRPLLPGDFTISQDDSGRTQVTFDADELLRSVNTKVNQNLLQATVSFNFCGHPLTSDTKSPLILLRQKLIVFIPGVMGSEIDTGYGSAFPKASTGTIPGIVPIVGNQPFEWLALGDSGEPSGQETATHTQLLEDVTLAALAPWDIGRSFSLKTIYAPDQWKQILDNPDSVVGDEPKITTDDGKPVRYYLYRPWSYDWRLRVEEHAAALLGGAGAPGSSVADTDPPDKGYSSPPSIAQMLADEKTTHPFLDDKIALVGHSTGGLIIRDLLTANATSGQNAIDWAFFVDVPFWGAPKAYYVFLSGDMEPSLVSTEIMRTLAPNTPIVYYLAPTELYNSKSPPSVAYNPFVAITDFSKWNTTIANRDSTFKIKRSEGQHVGDFMTPLANRIIATELIQSGKSIAGDALEVGVLEKALDGDPRALAGVFGQLKALKSAFNMLTGQAGLHWNDSLESAAQAFHQSIQSEPAIGFDHSVVFWAGSTPTPGPVYVDKANPIRCTTNDTSQDSDRPVPNTCPTLGDGTVPLLSQQADFPKSSLIELTDTSEHTAAANDPVVWQTVLKKLANVPDGDSTRFDGVKPIATEQTAEMTPPGEKSRAQKCADALKQQQAAQQQLAKAQMSLEIAENSGSPESAAYWTAQVQQLTATANSAASDYRQLVEGLGEAAMDSLAKTYGYTPLVAPGAASSYAQGFDGVYFDMEHNTIVIGESKAGYNGLGLDSILSEGYGYRQGTMGWVGGAARAIVRRQVPANASKDEAAAIENEKAVAQKVLDALSSGKPQVRVEVYHTQQTGCVAGPTKVYLADQSQPQ